MGNNDVPSGNKAIAETITQESLVRFMNSLADVPKEVLAKIVPDLSDLLSRGTEAFTKILKPLLQSNEKSQQKVFEHEKLLQSAYVEMLRLEKLTPEQRSEVIEHLEDGAKRVDKKDTENKAFLGDLLKMASTGVVAALAIALVIVASKPAKD